MAGGKRMGKRIYTGLAIAIIHSAAQTYNMETLKDIWAFLKARKKWWLAPLIIVLLVLGFLIILGGTALAPFVYTLF